jgi:hypothetical protein
MRDTWKVSSEQEAMRTTTRKNIIRNKMVHEGVCNAETIILEDLDANFESIYRWAPYGSRS